jgi:late competence protein required for DNA uptake (superfamily II DNA/RNA helicase)
LIFDNLFNHDGSAKDKHLFILKSTGLGISELMLRIIAWLCLKDNALAGSHICIITGPRIDLSVALVDRLKKLFYTKNLISFDTKETVVILNNVRIESFPSHHLAAMRGIPNVSMIFADEADFWNDAEQNEMLDTAERYIGKSNPWIVLCSTPNKPGGLFASIREEDENV